MWPEEASSTLTERAFRFASMIFQSLVKGPKVDASFSWVLFCVFFFFRFKVDSLLSSNKSSWMYSSNFWAPFTFSEIGLVVSMFSRISFYDKSVEIYLFKYNTNWDGKYHSFFMFSGFISNLQYIDTATFSDLSDYFLLPPLEWITES